MPSPRPVGLIGIGLLGSAIAERLIAAGHTVVGYDIDPARGEALESMGGLAVASAAAVAQGCDRVVLSLLTSEIVASAVGNMGEALRAGHILIDTTTGDPERTVALAKRLAEREVRYLDATVSGSSQQVRQGEAVVMAGGDRETLEACTDLLGCFASQLFHVGPNGYGATMKLVTNHVLGLHRLVLAEALAFACKLGLDLPVTLDVLKAGAAYSRVMDTKGQKMIDRDFTPQARLSQHLKDVRLILALGTKVGANLPLSELHRLFLEAAEKGGHGDADNSAIAKVFE